MSIYPTKSANQTKYAFGKLSTVESIDIFDDTIKEYPTEYEDNTGYANNWFSLYGQEHFAVTEHKKGKKKFLDGYTSYTHLS